MYVYLLPLLLELSVCVVISYLSNQLEWCKRTDYGIKLRFKLLFNIHFLISKTMFCGVLFI